MRLRVLGSSGAEFPGFNLPAFLIDGSTLFDAGTIGSALSEKEQWAIRHVFLTHAHLDHIRGIPFLADNIVVKNKKHFVTVISIPPVLKALKKHLLNNEIWPDFTAIPERKNAVLRLMPIKPGRPCEINGYQVTAFGVDHAVSAAGYLLEDGEGKRLLYTGDTGPTKAIWKGAEKPVDCLIVEVSLPNSMEEMAVKTGHLTANLLRQEIGKMKNVPRRILVTHLKPQHFKRIRTEIKRLGIGGIKVLSGGERIRI